MPRILIIEDDDRVRKMLHKSLLRNGFEVLEAANGREGIIVYRENDIDWVITDIIMPEKEGIETIRELKRDYPDVKIIAISGGGRIEPTSYLTIAKRFGVVATFEKPVSVKAIIDVINEGGTISEGSKESEPVIK